MEDVLELILEILSMGFFGSDPPSKKIKPWKLFVIIPPIAAAFVALNLWLHVRMENRTAANVLFVAIVVVAYVAGCLVYKLIRSRKQKNR